MNASNAVGAALARAIPFATPAFPVAPAAAAPVAGPAVPLQAMAAAPSLPAPVAVLERTFVPARPAAAAPAFPAALRDVEAARARIDGLLAEARRGRSFTPQELLCLQADAHRFAQSVELAARVVEHGVQGLRQALQAQV